MNRMNALHPEQIEHEEHGLRELFADAPLDEIEHELNDDPTIGVSSVPVMRQLAVALGLLIVVFGVTYVGTLAAFFNNKPTTDTTIVEERVPAANTAAARENHTFDNIKIGARSAYVWDARDQRVLFNKNGEEELPLASVTKLMTALVAYELLDEHTTIDISAAAIRADGDSGFAAGEEFDVQELTDLVLIASSNDGAEALGARAGGTLTDSNYDRQSFIDAMNIRAEELGLKNTQFENTTGLDLSPSEAGAYGSARDMAFLMEYIVTNHPNLIALTTTDIATVNNTAGEYHLAKNTNEVVTEIDGLIGSKTGYTELAGGNLVVAFDAGLNHPIIISVLGSTRDGRFEDVLELVARARTYVTSE